MDTQITAEHLLNYYRIGKFPMADSAGDDQFYICTPPERSILPIADLHVSKSLRKTVLKGEFEVRVNTSFSEVIEKCGEADPSRPETWINRSIKYLFNELHDKGIAHSVETWKNGELVGGLYGLELGSAFCGESMFSRARDASKVALVHLCARLKETGFTLLDAQLPNPHLEQFGQYLISQEKYLELLKVASNKPADFNGTLKSQTELVREFLLSPK